MSSDSTTSHVKIIVAVITLIIHLLMLFLCEKMTVIFILTWILTWCAAASYFSGVKGEIPTILLGCVFLWAFFFLSSSAIVTLLTFSTVSVIQTVCVLPDSCRSEDEHSCADSHKHKHRYDRCRCGKRRRNYKR